MGFFSNLLNPHRTKWKMRLNKIDASSKEAIIIRDFFLVDNINDETYELHKYEMNPQNLFRRLDFSNTDNLFQNLQGSPSFKKVMLNREYLEHDYYPDWQQLRLKKIICFYFPFWGINFESESNGHTSFSRCFFARVSLL